MIKSIEFKNYRNLNKKYYFKDDLNIVIGKNSSGKTNFLDGIKLAFSAIDGTYVKVERSDFKDSDDSHPIEIFVELNKGTIPSFDYLEGEETKCGFKLIISKTARGRYIKDVRLFEGQRINSEIYAADEGIPNVYSIPLMRIEDIYSPGLTTGLARFIESEEKYSELKQESKDAIKKEISPKLNEFKKFCAKFSQSLDIEVSDPRLANERLYVVDGPREHNIRIGSGYKSIANIFINTLDDKFNIILIDELENHLHASLLRALIHELDAIDDTFIVATTHSPVVINETCVKNLIDVCEGNLSDLDKDVTDKLDAFLHPGRNELILADNVVLVEGYTEEILLRSYLSNNRYNWTIVNVAGVMFEPYIKFAKRLKKRIVVISDNDKTTTKDLKPSQRFNNLKTLCEEEGIKIIEVSNTLETDLFENGFIEKNHLRVHPKHNEILVSKSKRKMVIVAEIIESKKDLSEWHVVRELEDEFKGN